MTHKTLIEKIRRDLQWVEKEIACLKKQLEKIRACLQEIQAELAGRIRG